MEFVPTKIKTTKQFNNACIMLLIEKFSLSDVLEMIQRTGMSKDQQKRVRKRMREVYKYNNTNSLLDVSPLATELDNAINNTYETMRNEIESREWKKRISFNPI